MASRQHLVLAALAVRLGAARAPDTGCTLCDLNEGINVFIAAFQRIRPDVLGPLLADCAPDPHLRAAFMTTLFHPPRAAVADMLERAVANGDLRDDIDLDLVLDMLDLLVHYRALFGHAATTDTQVERAVEALLRGIATNYPALLEHSRQVSGDSPNPRRALTSPAGGPSGLAGGSATTAPAWAGPGHRPVARYRSWLSPTRTPLPARGAPRLAERTAEPQQREHRAGTQRGDAADHRLVLVQPMPDALQEGAAHLDPADERLQRH